MNFLWDGKLYEVQQRVLDRVRLMLPVSEEDRDLLRGNIPSRLAYFLAPSNLVVATLVLLDLIEGRNTRQAKILKTCQRCCGINPARCAWTVFEVDWSRSLWLEGYSYWSVVVRYLRAYRGMFDCVWAADIMVEIEKNFQCLGFHMPGANKFPPPIGDVYEGPMAPWSDYDTRTRIGPVSMEWPGTPYDLLYCVNADPVGFNLHTHRVRNQYGIINGVLKGFSWYTGYRNKYPTVWSELREIFRWCRFVSLFGM